MPKAKPLSKEMIVAAMNKTKSNKAAARYLNVSYIHFKKWAKLYNDVQTGEVLFDKHFFLVYNNIIPCVAIYEFLTTANSVSIKSNNRNFSNYCVSSTSYAF